MIERFFGRLGTVIENRRRAIIIVVLILIAVSLFGATRITLATGTETWVSTDSQAYKDYERFNQHFGGNAVIVMITGDSMAQLLQDDNLTAMEYVETQMGANPNVISAIGPTFLMKQAVAAYTGTPYLPHDLQLLQMIVLDPQNGQIRPDFRSALPDDNHALIPIVLEGGLSPDDRTSVVEETQRVVAAASFVDVETVVTGEPALTSKLEELVSNSMRNMFIVAIILMFLILALIFSVRGFFTWRWLPLGAIGIGIVYTFGAMGLLSIPITMVSMGVFPILIGLGVDYSIQLHNRYDEETKRGKPPADAILASVSHVGPAIGIALIAVCLGFAAMLFSPVPMIRDFGLMLIIGVIACYIVAIFFPLTILYWRDRRILQRASVDEIKQEPADKGIGLVERYLQRLAPWVIGNPAIIIPIAIALTVAGLVADPYVKTETDMSKIISEDVPVMRDYKTLEAVAGGVSTASVLVEANDVTDPAILTWMLELEDYICTEMIETVSNTRSVASLVAQVNGGQIPQSCDDVRHCLEGVPVPIKRNLVSDDYTAANLIVGIREFDVALMKQLKEQLTDCASNPPAGVKTAVTGTTVIETELLEGMGGGRLEITLIGVGFIFLALFLLFRFSLLKALLAILPIALIIGWSSGLIFLSGIKYSPLTACLGALILGIGVEYTILLMMRYYEERGKGEGPREAMTTAMTKIGRAIIASGLTTAGGFAALLAAGGFLIVRDFGIMTLINVFLALMSSLVVLPPLIVWVDSWREKRRLAPVQDTPEDVIQG
jgi:hydrophobe/amphiphile efflux-3 (HAE3) family protein